MVLKPPPVSAFSESDLDDFWQSMIKNRMNKVQTAVDYLQFHAMQLDLGDAIPALCVVLGAAIKKRFPEDAPIVSAAVHQAIMKAQKSEKNKRLQ